MFVNREDLSEYRTMLECKDENGKALFNHKSIALDLIGEVAKLHQLLHSLGLGPLAGLAGHRTGNVDH